MPERVFSRTHPSAVSFPLFFPCSYPQLYHGDCEQRAKRQPELQTYQPVNGSVLLFWGTGASSPQDAPGRTRDAVCEGGVRGGVSFYLVPLYARNQDRVKNGTRRYTTGSLLRPKEYRQPGIQSAIARTSLASSVNTCPSLTFFQRCAFIPDGGSCAVPVREVMRFARLFLCSVLSSSVPIFLVISVTDDQEGLEGFLQFGGPAAHTGGDRLRGNERSTAIRAVLLEPGNP